MIGPPVGKELIYLSSLVEGWALIYHPWSVDLMMIDMENGTDNEENFRAPKVKGKDCGNAIPITGDLIQTCVRRRHSAICRLSVIVNGSLDIGAPRLRRTAAIESPHHHRQSFLFRRNLY